MKIPNASLPSDPTDVDVFVCTTDQNLEAQAMFLLHTRGYAPKVVEFPAKGQLHAGIVVTDAPERMAEGQSTVRASKDTSPVLFLEAVRLESHRLRAVRTA